MPVRMATVKAYIWKRFNGAWCLRLVSASNGLGISFNFGTFERAKERMPFIWKQYDGRL